MPEAVDRLHLVTDREEVRRPGRVLPADQFEQLFLQRVDVLQLVDQHVLEAALVALAQARVVAQQVARHELEVLEVERRAAVFQVRVARAEAREQIGE